MSLRSKVTAWLDTSDLRAERERRERAWTYAQANDAEVMAADPFIEEVKQAAELLDRDEGYAFYRLLTLAQQGSVWAMVNVGWCCHTGHGTSVSLADAEHWYRRAYEAGSDRALIDYVRLVRRRGDADLEAEIYAAGAARDWAPALYWFAGLGLRQARTLSERLAWKPMLERAAAKGNPSAQFLLSRYMLRGWFGLRHIPGGMLRAYRLVRAELTARDAQAEEDARSMAARPEGVTLQ